MAPGIRRGESIRLWRQSDCGDADYDRQIAGAARTARTAWEFKQYRWLLLCLVVGASPYVFLVKMPTLLGWRCPSRWGWLWQCC